MRDFVGGLPDAEALVRAERCKAVRLLLRHPFITEARPDPDVFALVRRHQAELRGWFREQLGYRLVVDHEQARLFKRRPPGALPRPVRTRYGRAFDRRRYSLLCLVLAALERSEVQTILSVLAEEVKLLAAATGGVAPLDLERSAERRCFVDAVRHLVALGVLQETDGDDTAFVRGGAGNAGGGAGSAGDVLYDVDSRRLARMLAAPVPPSLAAGPEALAEETYPPTEDGKNLAVRHRLMRRLVEEPVLYFDDLAADERAYLSWQRAYLIRGVEQWTGLSVEVRREGLAAIDADGRLSDVTFPSTSNAAHAALLFADELAHRLRAADGAGLRAADGAGLRDADDDAEEGKPRAVPRGELLEFADRLFASRRWGKAYLEAASGAELLLDHALAYLASLGLVRRLPEGVLPLPAIARYRVAANKGLDSSASRPADPGLWSPLPPSAGGEG